MAPISSLLSSVEERSFSLTGRKWNESSSSSRSFAGVPLELWRVVLSYLSVVDLARCCRVCKDWKELIQSLDSTRWKELFLQCEHTKRWKHPNWPNTPHLDPESWQRAYKLHYVWSKQWLHVNSTDVSCSLGHGGLIGLLRRKRNRRTLHVGSGKKFLTIKGALAAASPYDKIILEPSIYQEHFALTIKFPIEIIGASDPNRVVVTMPIEQQASTARIANIMVRPSYPRPRGSSSVLVKVMIILFISKSIYQ